MPGRLSSISRMSSCFPALTSGRNTPTDSTSRSNVSSNPKATTDLPVWPSGAAT